MVELSSVMSNLSNRSNLGVQNHSAEGLHSDQCAQGQCNGSKSLIGIWSTELRHVHQ